MESHPQNSEFRNNPENFHPCNCKFSAGLSLSSVKRLILCLYYQDIVERLTEEQQGLVEKMSQLEGDLNQSQSSVTSQSQVGMI